MSIKIQAPSGGGSVSLDTQQSVTGDHTLQLPTGVGSANQFLKNGGTAGTLEYAGLVSSDMPTGSILQVKQVVRDDRVSTTGHTWANALSLSITPTSTQSNILVLASLHLGNSANGYAMYARVARDNSAISGALGDGDSNRPPVTIHSNMYEPDTSPNHYQLATASIAYLDTAVSTTSPTTYQIQIASYGTATMYMNRSDVYQNTSEYDGTPISSLVLMEVAG